MLPNLPYPTSVEKHSIQLICYGIKYLQWTTTGPLALPPTGS